MSGYDTHFYIKELAKNYRKVNLIANTDEKYINCSINSGYGFQFDEDGVGRKFIMLSFVDTFRFMASSLEKLANGFNKEDCKHINNFIKDNNILGKILKRQDGDEDIIFKILSGKRPLWVIDGVENLKYDK